MALWGPLNYVHGSKPSHTLRVDTSRFTTENANSVVEGNVADRADQRRGRTRAGHENVYDVDIEAQLRDPKNLDFRPRAGSLVAKKQAGAYAAVEQQYWIPGRQEWRASVPVPPHGTVTAKSDLDLMFLPAYACEQHVVYLGTGRGRLALQGRLKSSSNVWLLKSQLAAGSVHYWRVDAVTKTGQVVEGEVWNFTVTGAPQLSVNSQIVV